LKAVMSELSGLPVSAPTQVAGVGSSLSSGGDLDKTQIMPAANANQATQVMRAAPEAPTQEKTQVFSRDFASAPTQPADLMATDRFAATQKFNPSSASQFDPKPRADDPFEKTIVARPPRPDGA
jgi:hypothetical protein